MSCELGVFCLIFHHFPVRLQFSVIFPSGSVFLSFFCQALIFPNFAARLWFSILFPSSSDFPSFFFQAPIFRHLSVRLHFPRIWKAGKDLSQAKSAVSRSVWYIVEAGSNRNQKTDQTGVKKGVDTRSNKGSTSDRNKFWKVLKQDKKVIETESERRRIGVEHKSKQGQKGVETGSEGIKHLLKCGPNDVETGSERSWNRVGKVSKVRRKWGRKYVETVSKRCRSRIEESSNWGKKYVIWDVVSVTLVNFS